MIVVILSYMVDPAQITAHREAHLAWLRAARDAGRLLLSGRKLPVTGGMLLVRGTLAEVSEWAATDPFAVHGLATYEFFEFEPSVAAPGLEALLS